VRLTQTPATKVKALLETLTRKAAFEPTLQPSEVGRRGIETFQAFLAPVKLHPLLGTAGETTEDELNEFVSALEEKWLTYNRESFDALEAYSWQQHQVIEKSRAEHLLKAMAKGSTFEEKLLVHDAVIDILGTLTRAGTLPAVGCLVASSAVQLLPLHEPDAEEAALNLLDSIAGSPGIRSWAYVGSFYLGEGAEKRPLVCCSVEFAGREPLAFYADVIGGGLDEPRTLGPWVKTTMKENLFVAPIARARAALGKEPPAAADDADELDEPDEYDVN
jgi:hypothetical protein